MGLGGAPRLGVTGPPLSLMVPSPWPGLQGGGRRRPLPVLLHRPRVLRGAAGADEPGDGSRWIGARQGGRGHQVSFSGGPCGEHPPPPKHTHKRFCALVFPITGCINRLRTGALHHTDGLTAHTYTWGVLVCRTVCAPPSAPTTQGLAGPRPHTPHDTDGPLPLPFTAFLGGFWGLLWPRFHVPHAGLLPSVPHPLAHR